jgi:hypothetical protein
MSDVWVVRNRGGDIVQITDYEPWEQPDGWTTTRETLLTPEMAALIEAAKAEVMWCLANPHDHDSKYWPPMVDAAYALWAVEGDV